MTDKNENAAQSDTPTNTIYSKLDFSWYFAGAYMDIMRSICCFTDDKECSRLFNELRDYVDKQFTKHCQGEINDIFVIAEQIIKSE